MQLGIELMIYGLSGVFSVLLIFMLIIKVITVLLPYAEDSDKD